MKALKEFLPLIISAIILGGSVAFAVNEFSRARQRASVNKDLPVLIQKEKERISSMNERTSRLEVEIRALERKDPTTLERAIKSRLRIKEPGEVVVH